VIAAPVSCREPPATPAGGRSVFFVFVVSFVVAFCFALRSLRSLWSNLLFVFCVSQRGTDRRIRPTGWMCNFEKNCPAFRDFWELKPFRTVKHAASRENVLTAIWPKHTSAFKRF